MIAPANLFGKLQPRAGAAGGGRPGASSSPAPAAASSAIARSSRAPHGSKHALSACTRPPTRGWHLTRGAAAAHAAWRLGSAPACAHSNPRCPAPPPRARAHCARTHFCCASRMRSSRPCSPRAMARGRVGAGRRSTGRRARLEELRRVACASCPPRQHAAIDARPPAACGRPPHSRRMATTALRCAARAPHAAAAHAPPARVRRWVFAQPAAARPPRRRRPRRRTGAPSGQLPTAAEGPRVCATRRAAPSLGEPGGPIIGRPAPGPECS